jgi:hypothetical protein
MWCGRNAPRTPAPDDVEALLRAQHTYAEETAERIIDLAGLGTAYPEPDAVGGVPQREIGASELGMYAAALPWMRRECGCGGSMRGSFSAWVRTSSASGIESVPTGPSKCFRER